MKYSWKIFIRPSHMYSGHTQTYKYTHTHANIKLIKACFAYRNYFKMYACCGLIHVCVCVWVHKYKFNCIKYAVYRLENMKYLCSFFLHLYDDILVHISMNTWINSLLIENIYVSELYIFFSLQAWCSFFSIFIVKYSFMWPSYWQICFLYLILFFSFHSLRWLVCVILTFITCKISAYKNNNNKKDAVLHFFSCLNKLICSYVFTASCLNC